MRLLIVAATGFELLPLKDHLEQHFVRKDPDVFQLGDVQVTLLVTGVGAPATVYALTRMLTAFRFDLVLNAGIAGAFDRAMPLGEVVQVEADTFADLGVEEADGSFQSVFDLQLGDPAAPPFQGGWLLQPASADMHFLPRVRGITVNKVHGWAPSIARIVEKYPVGIETMEGAAFFYVCLMEKVNFLALRAISNYVEPRNRAAWEIALAIDRLNQVLIALVRSFSSPQHPGAAT
jgi:futalosine hydrolase